MLDALPQTLIGREMHLLAHDELRTTENSLSVACFSIVLLHLKKNNNLLYIILNKFNPTVYNLCKAIK